MMAGWAAALSCGERRAYGERPGSPGWPGAQLGWQDWERSAWPRQHWEQQGWEQQGWEGQRMVSRR